MTRQIVLRRIAGVVLSASCLAMPTAAQESGTEVNQQTEFQRLFQEYQTQKVQRVFRLKHISPEQAWSLFYPWVGQENLRAVDALNIISVTGSKQAIDEIERTLAEIDVPQTTAPNASQPSQSQPNDTDVTVYYLAASETGEDDVPEQLQDTVTELRRHFPYKSYSLFEAFSIRARVGRSSSVEGLLPNGQDLPPSTYAFQFEVANISGSGAQRRVLFKNLHSRWRIPVKSGPNGGMTTYSEPSLNASLEIKEGVTTVVGKVASVGSNRSIFVVIQAKVVDP